MSKLAGGFLTPFHGPFRSLNLAPNSCVPSSAKMPRKRKSRTRSEIMASIELIREPSKFCRDFQYLRAEVNAIVS